LSKEDSNPIIFAGCSYTWGEGLELYQDDTKWIEARNSQIHHHGIQELSDEGSVQFREQNRFPGIVSNHYNTPAFVATENGGCEAASHRHIVNTINEQPKLDPSVQEWTRIEDEKKFSVIIYQFTALERNPPHFTYSCQCDRCLETVWCSIAHIWELINPIISDGKSLNDLLKSDIFNGDGISAFNHGMVKLIGIENTDGLDDIHHKLTKYFRKWKRESFPLLVEELKKIDKKIPMYFIPTWNASEHSLINQSDFIKDRTIPLIDENGDSHTNWKDWFKNIKGKIISYDFPKTQNDHPSLKTHKLLASSIIKFLDEKNVKIKKDYI